MPDMKTCMIQAPHEKHSWISAEPRKFAYHFCPGRTWDNTEVYNNLWEAIKGAINDWKPDRYEIGQPEPVVTIMAQIWPQVVGFLPPELVVKAEMEDTDWLLNSVDQRVMQIPLTTEDRNAQTLEHISSTLDKILVLMRDDVTELEEN